MMGMSDCNIIPHILLEGSSRGGNSRDFDLLEPSCWAWLEERVIYG